MGFYGAITSAWCVTRRYSGRASVRSTGTKLAQKYPGAIEHFSENLFNLFNCSIYAGFGSSPPLYTAFSQLNIFLIKNLIKKAQKIMLSR
jgi:hypothetical protein